MPILRTQGELRAVQNLPFCAICGEPFADDERPTRQHTPPKAVFAKADRDPPLIVAAHKSCNANQSGLDTAIGQLVAVLHGRYPKTTREVALRVGEFPVSARRTTVGVEGLPLRAIVFRWLRCFHAALYGEYLIDRGGNFFAPFPAGDLDKGIVQYTEEPVDRVVFTELIRREIKAGRVDGIDCCNGTCRYRCAWLTFDNGAPFCVYALRLYNWEALGDAGRPNMGCVGWYGSTMPRTAAVGAGGDINPANCQSLDPFAA